MIFMYELLNVDESLLPLIHGVGVGNVSGNALDFVQDIAGIFVAAFQSALLITQKKYTH